MRVLLVGQAAQTSGYGRVLRSLAPLLAERFDVSYYTLNCRQAPALPGVAYLTPWLRSDPYGFAALPEVLDKAAPDVLLACHDAAVLAHYARLARAHRPRVRIVLYVPLEWDHLSPESLAGLRLADLLVCYTHTARTWLKRRLGAGAPPVAVLPHAVDRAVFGPVGPDGTPRAGIPRADARAAARRLLGFPGDGPLVLNANRDTPRKRLDATLRAFSLIVRDVPEAHLLLVHGQRHRGLADELGLGDRVVILAQPPDDGTLNLCHNAADLGLNTCSAEGWGLVAFEQAVSGVAQVLPAHPAQREIWSGGAVFVPYPETEVDGYGLVGEQEVAAAATVLLRDTARREALGRAARDLAAADRYTWPEVAAGWTALLDPSGTQKDVAPPRP